MHSWMSWKKLAVNLVQWNRKIKTIIKWPFLYHIKMNKSYFLSSQGGPLTSSERIHCLSSHLTSFGSGTFVAPNPINFRKVALGFTKAFETGNVVVLFTIVALFAVFLMLGVWARRADKRGLLQVRRLGRCYVACLVCVDGCHGVYAGN